MIEAKITDILNDKQIPVGKKLSLIGEFRRGAPAEEIKKAEKDFAKVADWYLDEIVLIDFSKLEELDSIGIRNTFPPILKFNKELKAKGRTLIAILGNKSSDLYRAIRDKFPDEDLDSILPWFVDEESFLKSAEIN